LLSFVAAEAAKAEQAADFGAGGIHFDGGLLRGELPVLTFGHGWTFLTVHPSADISPVHSSDN
jgi:hypothetical protein